MKESMELVLNDLSLAGQFRNYEEFEDYFVRILNALLEVIAEKKIPLYKMADILNREVVGNLTLAQIFRSLKNNAAASVLRKRIIQIMDNPYLDGEENLRTVQGISYDYPGKTEEPNCFTEAIERNCPLLSFPETSFQDAHFECAKEGIPLVLLNIKNKKDLLDYYLVNSVEDIKYILSKYPFPKKVRLAEKDHKCYAEEALLENHLSIEDIQKIIGHIPDLIADKSSGRKTHWWDIIDGKINEYRVTVSEGREFRIFFLWEEALIFMNGFIKKSPATPVTEKKRAKEIEKSFRRENY